MSAVLEARSVTKRFGAALALREVSFELRSGEVHALCGENGAGKSTLIKILAGLHPYGSYEGTLLLGGQELRLTSVREAAARGIGVVWQELALVPELTVAENVFLGREPLRGFGLRSIDLARAIQQTRSWFARFAVPIDPEAKVASLGIGQRQLVEIVKALSREPQILVLDEPTAALATHEVQVLLDLVRDLRSRGVGCLYVSHRLDEVMALADRVTVLRDGAPVSTLPVGEVTAASLVQAMVGRPIESLFPRRFSRTATSLPAAPTREDRLRVEGLVVEVRGKQVLRDISLEALPGEVLGIGGLMGAGRSELLLHLFGAFGHRRSGTVWLDGVELPPSAGPKQCVERGMVMVGEDRKRQGLVLERGVAFNLSLSSLLRFTRPGSLGLLHDEPAEQVAAREMTALLSIRARDPDAPVRLLSGGNQQKVVLGRALLTRPKVVLLDEPTRGVDVGAKVEIYEQINHLTDRGCAVILVSSELPELMGMSDRILMLREGAIGGCFGRGQATAAELLRAALPQARASSPVEKLAEGQVRA